MSPSAPVSAAGAAAAPKRIAAARALAARLPALLASARRLAAAAQAGAHGRRQAGPGEDFWQFRQAMPGDHVRAIDWRRSARDDRAFVREREWQAPQSVHLWIDHGQAMEFSGDPAHRPTKRDRADLVGLALAILLVQGGERVGLLGDRPLPPATGPGQIDRIALALCSDAQEEDHAAFPPARPRAGAHVVMISDFLGPEAAFRGVIEGVAARGVQGQFLQIVDPVEEGFPFAGRTLFASVSGAVEFETLRADALRDRYLARFAARRDMLAAIARRTGWRMGIHHTDHSPLQALIWAWHAISGRG